MANLKFTSTGSTTITLSGNGLSNSFFANNSAYTLGTAISLADGETVEFYGTGTDFSKDANNFYQFAIGGTGTVTVEGDLISLTNNSPYLKQYQFMKLFAGCDKITSIKNLNFPATIADWCYANMFMDCTGLVDAGTTLPATATSRWCYQGMFARCSSMTTPPTILATKLSPFCYYGMFTGCTSLIEGPELNNTVVEGQFSNNIMFKDCSNLSTIQVSFTNWPSGNWSRKWLDGVAQTGLFVKPTTLTSIPEGYVPAGWSLSSVYPAKIIVDSETISFDAMSDTTQISGLAYTYQNGTETLNINIDTTNKPSWLTVNSTTNPITFSANGYAIDSSTSFEIPITFSAADAETKNVVATFNISNYPTYTITFDTISAISWDFEEATTSSVNLLQYIHYDGSSLSTEVTSLPQGVVYEGGILSANKELMDGNVDTTFNLIASALDARTATASNIALDITGLDVQYDKLPLTFEAISNNVTVALPLFIQNTLQSSPWGGSNSPLTGMLYRKYTANNDSWGSWIDWKANNFAAVSLDTGDKIELSGNNGGNFSRSWGNYFNRFTFGGTGQLIMYGNISSMFVPGTTSVDLTNIWLNQTKGTTQLADASKTLIPYQARDTGNAFEGTMGFNTNMSGAPLMLTQTHYGCYNYCFNGCSNLKTAEFCWTNATTSWYHEMWMNNVQTTSGIFIVPSGTYINNRGNHYIPSNWTVLYRRDGYLYNTNGTLYTGTDPYQWYWKYHRS